MLPQHNVKLHGFSRVQLSLGFVGYSSKGVCDVLGVCAGNANQFEKQAQWT